MSLYELHAYRTAGYDRKSDRRVRIKDDNFGLPRVWAWIDQFLAEFPDGKVVVSECKLTRRFIQRGPGRKQLAKLIVATNTGAEYRGGYQIRR
jgi:hypothetical protein